MNVKIAVLALLLPLPLSLAAQVVPSDYVPLAGNCALYDSGSTPLAANTTAYVAVRGACNVPAEANAVAVQVFAFAPATAGELQLFDSGIVPGVPFMAFQRRIETSGSGIVRLCYPALECSVVDIGLRASASGRYVILVSGYFQPRT